MVEAMQNIFVRDAVKASHGRLLSGDADAQLAYISIDSRTAGKKADRGEAGRPPLYYGGP